MNQQIQDKIVLVTGSTDGIGWQTAHDLAVMGARVIVHGRSEEKAKHAAESIASKSGSEQVEYVAGDLSSLQEIKTMADVIHKRYDGIDVLINNAGVLKNERETSRDGYELTFAVNHLAYFYLAGLLLDLLQESTYSRIVNVASQAHAGKLDFDNLQGEKFYDDYDAYSRSKLCNILFTKKLARMLGHTKPTVNALHPGVISTKLLHAGWGSGGADWSMGSRTSVYLATSNEVADLSGDYFSGNRRTKPAPVADDWTLQDRLWHESEKMTGFSWGL